MNKVKLLIKTFQISLFQVAFPFHRFSSIMAPGYRREENFVPDLSWDRESSQFSNRGGTQDMIRQRNGRDLHLHPQERRGKVFSLGITQEAESGTIPRIVPA